MPVLRAVGTVYVNIFRNTPLTLIFVFCFFGLPKIGVTGLSPFQRAVIALTVYTVGVHLRGAALGDQHRRRRARPRRPAPWA